MPSWTTDEILYGAGAFKGSPVRAADRERADAARALLQQLCDYHEIAVSVLDQRVIDDLELLAPNRFASIAGKSLDRHSDPSLITRAYSDALNELINQASIPEHSLLDRIDAVSVTDLLHMLVCKFFEDPSAANGIAAADNDLLTGLVFENWQGSDLPWAPPIDGYLSERFSATAWAWTDRPPQS